MTVMVGAPTQGVIDTIEVERSDMVSAGQVLARLHSGVESAALEHARVRATMKSEIPGASGRPRTRRGEYASHREAGW